jgi:hypothetical protein
MTSSETRGTKELSMKLIVHGENVLNVKSNNRFFRPAREKYAFSFFLAKRLWRYPRDTVAIELELPGGENYKYHTVLRQEIDGQSTPSENVCALQTFSITITRSF